MADIVKPIVAFHADCPDGTGAALAAYLKFDKEAEYVPVVHGDEPPDVKGRVIYILDFCWDRPTMERLKTEATELHVIDHHVSAREAMAGFQAATVTFDMEHSGAVLAWMHFHPDRRTPELLLAIEDRDLWRWKIAGSEALNKGLWLEGFNDPKKWVKYVQADPWSLELRRLQKVRALALSGEQAIAYERRLFEFVMPNAYKVTWHGRGWSVLNFAAHQSDLVNLLAQKTGNGIVWNFDGAVNRVSLRSKSRGGGETTNVAAIAKLHGGGGHLQAAGFACAQGALPWLLPEVR